MGPSASEFTNFDAEFGPAFEPYVDRNTMRVNLWKLTHDQLVTAGVPADNIYAIDLCTFSLPRTFFSYR
ncbi:laccase domain-containing protein, partial [Oceanidesulfovibrio marinus]